MSGQAPDGGSAADIAIVLVRHGKRGEAIPYLEQAVAAGDHRAQYLLGVALYNGDDVVPDAARAAALLSAAAAGGIAQARTALDDMAASTRSADGNLLVSARCAGRVAADLARLQPLAGSAPLTLEDLTRELLRPLLRDRLEAMLPPATRRAVEHALLAGQARPDRS